MSTAELEAGTGWQELDDQAMAGIEGGGPFAEFVYDFTHTVITVIKFVNERMPKCAPGHAGFSTSRAG